MIATNLCRDLESKIREALNKAHRQKVRMKTLITYIPFAIFDFD
jgi:hypothetical protein